MILRYQEKLVIGQNTESTRYFKTALVQSIPDTNMGTTHKVRFGDRFDNLAFKYYKTPTLWWYIAKANHMVDGSLTPPIGTVLIIPHL